MAADGDQKSRTCILIPVDSFVREPELELVAASRTNLTVSGPRPNLQGSYHYGSINMTRSIRLASSAGSVAAGGGRLRYAVNGVSFSEADTPTASGPRPNP
ncbi:hypothetical protein C2845_PM15G11600 [Panicum miliaceum]|uniref:Uncharacterized protein n=1 Tax=Panicum miliaceum TaxID=4540 RepID=A0A3L6Q9Y5_PANMI|nr:hypothetical protein C2845_PM15G11600 [Panicum miliaceum]